MIARLTRWIPSDSARLVVLILIMTAVAVGVGATMTVSLYDAAFRAQQQRVVETAISQARLIEAVARFDAQFSSNTVPGGAYEATLGQIRAAHERFQGSAESEIVVGRHEGEHIVLLLNHSENESGTPTVIPYHSDRAEPMRRALRGESGTTVTLDYRGVPVLAAYEPVDLLNVGVVVKVDVSQVRKPFLQAGLAASGVCVAFVVLATFLFRSIGNPLVQRVRESERRYRTLFDSGTEGVLLLTDSFEECNLQACKLWACERNDIIGGTLLDFSPKTQPDGRQSEAVLAQLLADVRGGNRCRFEWRNRRKDGALIETEMSLKSVEVSGRTAILVSVRDITEHRRTLEALKQRERELTTRRLIAEIFSTRSGSELYGSVLEILLRELQSNDGLVAEIDKGMARLVASGDVLLDRPAQFDSDEWKGVWGDALREKRTMYANHLESAPFGLFTTSGVLVAPVVDDGDVIGMLLVANKTSDYDEVDRKFLDAVAWGVGPLVARTLEQNRRQEERKDVEAELIRAKRVAEEASIAKSNFLATMSHELRTPLNAIIGLTDLLLKTELDADQKESAQMVVTAGNAMLALVNDVLDVSKIEAHKLELCFTQFELRAAVENAALVLAPKARQKGVVFNCYFASDVPSLVRGDPDRLKQVISNLVSNAVKFTEHGHVTVRVAANRLGLEETTVRLEVADTGIGIPKTHHDKLFDPFHQVDNSTSRKYGGTGLGLAISKKLITAMGGEIGFVSDEGQGSTFWFEVPLMEEEVAADPAVVQRDRRDRKVTAERGSANSGAQVLVVEDDLVNQRVALRMLQHAGFEVDIASNGREALDKLQMVQYDVVVMDVQMPGLDGFQTARMIRDPASSVLDHKVPIIAVTAMAMKGDRELCRKAGMDEYITKPIEVGPLVEAVNRLSARRPSPLPGPCAR